MDGSAIRHDILIRIKRAMLTGRYRFTVKASDEIEADGLTGLDVVESILNSVAIYKTLRSRSRFRQGPDRLYVIAGPTLSGLAIYTKGKLLRRAGMDY